MIKTLLSCSAILVALCAQAAAEKVSILHSTDLCHPHDDPDDHYDLACLFALTEFDVKGIVLDRGEHQAARPGRPPVEQMMHITGRRAPYAIGLSQPLRKRDDKALEQPEEFQGGVRLILSVLRDAKEKVVLHTTGSCRDVAAAFNREPELFKQKVKAVYMEIGNGPDGDQDEFNVRLCPLGYAGLLESGLPIYWCPCFGTDGYGTFYTADQSVVVGACAPAVRNYFAYCLKKSKDDPLAFLNSGPNPLPKGRRQMWCTAPMLHAAGRKIYQRGDDDFVALSPRDAEKAGLAAKEVEVYQFVPVRVKVSGLPGPGKDGKKPSSLKLSAELNPPQSTTFVFRATSPQYGKVLASCLKNLLSELGKPSNAAVQATNPKADNQAAASGGTAVKTHPIAGALRPSPKVAGFRMEGYYVWGGSIVKADGRFHLFASRWPEGTGKGTGVAMLAGYRQHSEIVRAVADDPLGPYEFKEVVLKGRGGKWWDGQMCHNPKIVRIGDTFVLYYIGSAVGNPLRKIGYAWSKSVTGPWTRIDRCLPIGEDCNNPAPYVHENGRILLAFRIRGLRIDIAAADAWNGTYRKIAGNICPQARLEDPDLAFRDGWYHLIAEDCYGTLTGHTRHGAHLISQDGIHWKEHDPVEAYTHTIRWTDGTQTKVDRRERPELFNAGADRKGTGGPTHLVTGIQVGPHTWCHVQQIAPLSSKERSLEQTGGMPICGTVPKPPRPRDMDPYVGLYEGTYEVGGSTVKAEARVATTGPNSPYIASVHVDPEAIEGDRFSVTSTGGYNPLDVYTGKDGDKKGVQYAYYEGGGVSNLEFGGHTPIATGTLPTFSLEPSKQEKTYGFRFTGFVKIPSAGRYGFYLTCDDRGRLSIGDKFVVESENSWYLRVPQRGVVELDAGMHPVAVDYYQHGHLSKLDVGIRKITGEDDEHVVLYGDGLDTQWQGRLLPDKLVLTPDDPAKGKFVLEYVDRQSPTRGRKPPEGAAVLLRPGEGGMPSLDEWTNKAWAPLPDGSMMVGKGATLSVKEFGDMEMHLEFMCPYEPENRYQGRGNSGVYVQGRYELQVLDSFGFPERINTCGAVYYIAPCLRSATLPPLTWQTFDVIFRAPRFAEDGTVEKDAMFEEVKLNGRIIHKNLALPKGTYGGMRGPLEATGPLMLQDHNNPVRYRNIWIRPL